MKYIDVDVYGLCAIDGKQKERINFDNLCEYDILVWHVQDSKTSKNYIIKCLPAWWLSIAFSDTDVMFQFCLFAKYSNWCVLLAEMKSHMQFHIPLLSIYQ